MSGATFRRCVNCGLARHCPDYPHGSADVTVCPCWRPRPAPKEPKPVAGCEYCRLPVAVYREDTITGASVVIFTASRTMRVLDRDRIQTAEFSINCCPNCGRDLRGE